MRTYIITIALLVFCLIEGYSQNRIVFEKIQKVSAMKTNDSLENASVILRRNDNSYNRPSSIYAITFEQDGWKEWMQDCKELLENEFSNISKDDYSYLNKIKCYVWIFPDGSCRCDYFRVPIDALERIPDLETHLSNFVHDVENVNFIQYQMIFASPVEKENSLCRTVFPFFWINKNMQ